MPGRRLAERPFVRDAPAGLWPHHLHSLIRSTLRTAEDGADDHRTDADWHRAAQRAHAALGQEWRDAGGTDRALLIGCLRQALVLARDHQLDLGWLEDAAWQYVSDSVWEPLAPPRTAPAGDAGGRPELRSAADALVETRSALARRQHEHRERTAARLAAVADTGLLPLSLQDMAIYYRAKAERDLGRSEASRRGMSPSPPPADPVQDLAERLARAFGRQSAWLRGGSRIARAGIGRPSA